MRIVLTGWNEWRIQGVALLLEQAGIPFSRQVPIDPPDVLVSDELADVPEGSCGLFVAPFHQGRRQAEGPIEFEGRRIHCPVETIVPDLPVDAEPVARFDDGSPAIVRIGRAFYVLPDLFSYIARLSTLRCFSAPFAESFSWDGSRELLVRLLEMCAKRIAKPLVRLWYYPAMRFNNSLSFTSDIDHRLAWDIVRHLGASTHAKAVANRMLPHSIKMLMAMSIHGRYHNTRIPDSHLTAARARWAGAFARTGLHLPAACYPAAMARIHARGIPITVFLRPSARQVEERLDPPPVGTGRLGYVPTALSAFEVGLHFGATVGRLDGGAHVSSPYDVDVFGADIGHQKELLDGETGRKLVGARLHHVYGFNQAMFRHLEQAGVLYDSSVFGSVGQAATPLSPVGGTLPYRPIIEDTGGLRWASFVELPVTVYEGEQLPEDILVRNHSCVILSEHPDRVASELVRHALGFASRRRGTWWPVSLMQLAQWWQRRARIGLSVEGEAVTLARRDETKGGLCLVVYPASYPVRFGPDIRILSDAVRDGERRFVDVAEE